MSGTTRRPTVVQHVARVGNRLLDPVLSSPRLVRLLGMEPIRIRYTGRRSGKQFELPAWAKPTSDGLVVRVGAPSQKGWWRNFRTAQPMEVRLEGSWRACRGVVVEPRPGAVEVHVTWVDAA